MKLIKRFDFESFVAGFLLAVSVLVVGIVLAIALSGCATQSWDNVDFELYRMRDSVPAGEPMTTPERERLAQILGREDGDTVSRGEPFIRCSRCDNIIYPPKHVPAKVKRSYTVEEIDDLRAACEARWLWGTTYDDGVDRGLARSYYEVEKSKAVEEMVRTYMTAGITGQQIRDEDERKARKAVQN